MDDGINVGGADFCIGALFQSLPQNRQNMFAKLGLFFITGQNKRVAAVGNADVQSFLNVIDIRVMLPVQQGQERQVVKFNSGDYGELL